MSELSDRMLRDLKLAGLVEGTRQQYLRTVYDWPLFTKKKSANRGRSGCPTSAATRTAAA